MFTLFIRIKDVVRWFRTWRTADFWAWEPLFYTLITPVLKFVRIRPIFGRKTISPKMPSGLPAFLRIPGRIPGILPAEFGRVCPCQKGENRDSARDSPGDSSIGREHIPAFAAIVAHVARVLGSYNAQTSAEFMPAEILPILPNLRTGVSPVC